MISYTNAYGFKNDRLISGHSTMYSIQFLRFVAATAVVIFHAHISFADFAAKQNVLHGSTYWFTFGKVGVHIFFAISGYIMYLTSFSRSKNFNVTQFLVRRALRVFPIYWVFVIFYLALSLVLQTAPNLSWLDFLGMLALAPGSAPLVIGPAWTLSYEVYFYLAFGSVMCLGAQRGTLALTALFMASIVVGVITRPASATAMMVTNALLIEFLMGVWIARLTLGYTFSRNAGWLALALALIGYALGLAWGYNRLPSAIMWGIPSALLILGAVIVEQRSAGMPRILRRLSRLGDSSYSLYLCHILLITIILATLRSAQITVSLSLLVAATTLACIWSAAIFHAVVEKPLTETLHRLTIPRSRKKALAVQPNG